MYIFKSKRISAAVAAVVMALGIAGCNSSDGSEISSTGGSESGSVSCSTSSSTSSSVSGSTGGSTSSSVSSSASGSASGSVSSSTSSSASSSVSGSTSGSASGSVSSSSSGSLSSSASGSTYSNVEEANALAERTRVDFEKFMSEAEAQGYGAGQDTLNVDLVVLDIEKGKWSCTVDDSERYNLTDFTKFAEEKLCAEFSEKYADLDNSTLVFSVFDGECTGAFCVDCAYGEIGEGFEIFDLGLRGGEFPASYKWNGGSAGKVIDTKSGKKYTVGTSPVVPMNEAAEVRPDDDSISYSYRNAKAMYATLNGVIQNAEKRGFGLNKLSEPHTLILDGSFGTFSIRLDDELAASPENNAKFCMEYNRAVQDEHDYSSVCVIAYIVNGECKGIVFLNGGGAYDFVEEYPQYADFEKGSYHWDSAEELGSVNGITMGVYPELAYAE